MSALHTSSAVSYLVQKILIFDLMIRNGQYKIIQ